MTWDAFQAFDWDKNGVLSIEELYGGLTWLGVEISAEEVREIHEEMDRDGDGCVTVKDFRRVLGDMRKRVERRRVVGYFEGEEEEEEEEEEVVVRGGGWEEGGGGEGEEGGEGGEGGLELKWQEIRPRSVRPEKEVGEVEHVVAEGFFTHLFLWIYFICLLTSLLLLFRFPTKSYGCC